MPQPTDAQKEAGNYPMDRLSLHGLPITIENRKGTIRSGSSRDGRPWSVVLPYDYGYIRKTLGADGDHVDTFIGPKRGSQFVVIVNQYDRQTGKFEEVKVGLGYESLDAARAAYRQGYRGANVPRATFHPTTVQKLKEWLRLKQTWSKFDFAAGVERLTNLATDMKRVVEFRQPNPAPAEKEKPSALRKVAAVLGAGAVIGGFYKYQSTRPDAKKHAYRMARGKVAADPVRQSRLAVTAGRATPVSSRPAPAPTPPKSAPVKAPSAAPTPAAGSPSAVAEHYEGPKFWKKVAPEVKPMGTVPAAWPPLRKSDVAKPAKVKAKVKAPTQTVAAAPAVVAPVKAPPPGGNLLQPKVLGKVGLTPEEVRKLTGKNQKVNYDLLAKLRLINFQDRNRDGTLGVSTSPLGAYRAASRVVPWVGRAHEAAGDVADIASGKKVKDPFYKKTWFKRAALTAAIGAPLLGAKLARSGERKKADGMVPSTGKRWADKVDRATHSAADVKRKLYDKVGLAAKIKNPILLQAVVEHLNNFDYTADQRGWDLRDARGRSARVYAPGSRRRDRREKSWDEKTDNIRLVRNIAIGGTIAGVGAALHYRNKANKLAPKTPVEATNVIQGEFRKKALAAGVRTTDLARKSAGLHSLIDATKNNISAPERPELPGEGAVKFVYGLPPKRRSTVLRILGAGTVAGGGLIAGTLAKRPKTGAALGGLAAGLILK